MEVLQRTANRGSISTGYDIDNSLKFEAANNESLQRAAVTGNRRTFTQSCWLKRSSPGLIQQFICYGSFHHATRNYISTDDKLYVDISGTPNEQYQTVTNRLFRDPSAWYHIVVAIDTTQATESNRLKIYVNGVQETSFAAQSIPAQNFDTLANIASSPGAVFGNMGIGAFPNASLNNRTNGYLAEAISVDGQALDPTSFGEFDEDSGIWKPIDVSGLSFGNNGYYLDFKDSSNLGNDVSGGTDWTETNITAADQATDTPTNNFATGNPLAFFSNPTMATFNAITEGATQFKKGANGWETMTSNIAVTSGKWYCEIQNISAPESVMMGITPVDSEIIFRGGRVSYHMGASSGDGGVAHYGYNGTLYKESVGITYSPSPTWANGTDVMGIALDMDNGKVYFAKANTWMNNGDPTTGSTGTGAVDIPDYTTKPYVFGYSLYANNNNGRMNFGGYTSGSISSAASDANGYGTFEYAPPSGYYALCTKNLAEYG